MARHGEHDDPTPDAPDLGASSRAGYFDLSRGAWHSLLFVLPLVILFELGSVLYLTELQSTVSAFRLIGRFYHALGAYGLHLPAIALVTVLLLQHVLSHASWRVRWMVPPAMVVECAVWTAPLLVLALLFGPQAAAQLTHSEPAPQATQLQDWSWQARMTIAIGAGLYEELLFRMLLIAIVHMLVTDFLRLGNWIGAIAALGVSAVAFAFYHDVWTDSGGLDVVRWSFFALSGVYFAGVYLLRGFGIVVGLHVFYDVLALLVIGRDAGFELSVRHIQLFDCRFQEARSLLMSDEQGHPADEPLVSEFASDPDMIEIVEYFVEELPKRVQAIRSAATDSDVQSLRTLAHQLKGAAPGYGFAAIGDAAGVLEAALSEMTVDGEQLGERTPIVLVIDDCEDVHRLLTARLRNEAMELVCETGGEVGLERIHQLQPSLVVLDLEMPGMDGFEVLRRMKDDINTSDIPVVVLSGMQSPNDKVTAFDLGAVDYITKPFDLMELRVRLRSALKMRHLIQMLAQRAQIDGLTGLWNRAHFDERWTEEVKRAERSGSPLSLAVFDLDHFKQVNDTYGHPAGDAVLQGVARLIQQVTRQADVACRYGGEEFVVIMPDTPPEQALNLCERIRVALSETDWPGKPSRPVTISAGVAGSDGQTSTGRDEWIELADKNLYRAKSQGRNRACMTHVGGAGPRLADAG
eukprot:g5666.t1